MALPTFSKTGLTTLAFRKGTLYPASRPLTFRQVKAVSDGGVVRVATIGPPEETLALRFERLPSADYVALRAWLTSATINGSAAPFTYTDEDGTVLTVRWWPSAGTFDMPEVAAGLYNVTIELRVEQR